MINSFPKLVFTGTKTEKARDISKDLAFAILIKFHKIYLNSFKNNEVYNIQNQSADI